MKYKLIFCIAIFLSACSSSVKENEITVKVAIKNFPYNKLYLGDAYKFRVLFDSALRKNDSFVFHIIPTASFEPQFVSLYYDYSDDNERAKVLTFRNYILSPTVPTKYFATAFMLEKGVTKITGDVTSSNKLEIQAHRETDVYFEKAMTEFGYIDRLTPDNRSKAIKHVKSYIRDHSFSFYLLQCIRNNWDLYSKAELKEILSLFDEPVQKSALGKHIALYIAERQDPGLPFPDIQLLTTAAKRQSIINFNSKLNILVFWASWCGPCRKEIPGFKKIDSTFKNAGLHISSLSTDDLKEAWTKALIEEKMPWQQFYIDSSEAVKIKARFSIGSIPVVIFIDKNGKEIRRNIGYHEDTYKNDSTFIGQYLLSH